jgi:hypothetical protein
VLTPYIIYLLFLYIGFSCCGICDDCLSLSLSLSLQISMARGMGLTALIVVLVLVQQTCNTTAEDHCPPSSCGSIPNISYPFRLTSDPKNCGDQRYNLSCENNQTLVLHLYDGRYFVRQINYTNYKIRVVDPGIGLNANEYYSFIPRYSLDRANFSSGDPYQVFAITVYFVKCEKRVNSRYHLNISACFEDRVYPNSKRYTYALFQDSSDAVELGDLCQVEQISFISYSDRYYEDLTNISCTDFHNDLLQGFKLSWHQLYCGSCRVEDCYVNRTNNIVSCYQEGAYIKECMREKRQHLQFLSKFLTCLNFNYH